LFDILTTVCAKSGIANTPNVAAERDGHTSSSSGSPAAPTYVCRFFIEDAADGLKTQQRLPEAGNPD
jgi:hypothetical protein